MDPNVSAAAIVGVFAWLQFKHFIFDYVLQTPFQFRNKGTYGHPGGILHSGLQAIGTIPADAIVGTPSRSRGTANALDSVTVRHASGGLSTLWFKSYEQGRRNWQGPTLDCMSFDEEPPSDIWAEGTTRCNAVHDARIWATFTPLEGLSEVVTLLMAGRPLKALFNVD